MATNPNQLVLSDLTVEYSDFVDQFNTFLQNQAVWQGTLTTQTSQTLVGLGASIGTFQTTRIYRATEDAFPETALSDDAIRSTAQMQGLRMTRFLPAAITATVVAPADISIPALTQFTVGGSYYFARQQFTLLANTPQVVTLFEGSVIRYSTQGLGTDLQAWISSEDSFTVSDQDVQVTVNNVIIPKAFGGLWNYDNQPAYSDLTLADGRLLVQFGNAQFGTIPQINDTVIISYPITQGAAGNNQTLAGKVISVSGFSSITGTVLTNPTGGANDKPVIAYKNVASGSFGTYSSAVTRSQYVALVGTYPGIVDAVTQAQREINPMNLQYMNVIRVSGLTTSPWTTAQIQAFVAYMQTITMYAPYFIWQDAIAVPNDVHVAIYCFNSVILGDIQVASQAAIQQLFAPKPGVLLTNYYGSDLIETILAASPGLISYVEVITPTGAMIVTAPVSPQLTLTQIAGGGSLGPLVYAYAISTVIASGEEGPPTNWAFSTVSGTQDIYGIQLNWVPVANAVTYHVWGRSAGGLGLLASIPAGTTSFLDNGSVTPSGGPPNTIPNVPIRYNSLRNLTVDVFYAERQQRMDNQPYRGNNG